MSEYQPETVETVKNKLRTYTRDGFAGVKRQPFNTETYKLAAGENILKKEMRKAKGDPTLAFDALARKAKNINMIRTVVLDELAKAVEDGNTDMINVADAAAKVGARYVDVMRRPEDQQTHTAVMFQLAAFHTETSSHKCRRFSNTTMVICLIRDLCKDFLHSTGSDSARDN